MYTKTIEAELILQKLNEENEALKQKLKELELDDSVKVCSSDGNGNSDGNRYYNNKSGINDNMTTDVDFDIFKKIQEEMNQRAKVLDDTLNKYTVNKENHSPSANYQHDYYSSDIKRNDNYSQGMYDLPEPMNYNEIKNDERIHKGIETKHENIPFDNSYQSYIFKIPSILLDNKLEEISLYVRLELSYQKLSEREHKLHFITLLKQVLNNIVMLKQTCFTVFLQLFNFIVSLLSSELLSEFEDSEITSNLQSLGEFILINKDLTETLRVLIVMIKRYFPTNIKSSINTSTELHLRILLFFLKKLTLLIQSSYVHISEVFSETNDFLYSYPPSLLSKKMPNIDLYLEIYQEIRTISNELIDNSAKNVLCEAIAYVKNKNSTPSDEYIKYLEYKLYNKH